ncbi:MAG: alpha/beta fold hydrolase [Chloroflexi bacterium]|nr:alpha/beta fold hydrolase [Chloroflexota bacterium]
MTTKTYSATFTEVLAKIAKLNIDVWPSKHDIVDEEGIFRLLHYQPVAEERYRTPLLIVYAFINRPYVLDLHAEVSVVQKYLKAGFDVYMIDWGYPTSADQFITLGDYMDYVDRSVRRVKRIKGVDQVNLHGYCLGGTLSAAYTALRQANVKNLMLQAAPIDFHTNNLIAVWARSLDPDKVADAYHMAPGSLLNMGFLMVDPVNLVAGKYEGLLDLVDSSKQMASFLRMDRFIFDSPAIPGDTYREYIRQWYHENRLIRGEFQALGEKVDLSKITSPVLVLAAQFDHIVPPESQKAILRFVKSQDKDVFEMDKGHIGITTSRDSHREFWPRVVRWLEERSDLK